MLIEEMLIFGWVKLLFEAVGNGIAVVSVLLMLSVCRAKSGNRLVEEEKRSVLNGGEIDV